MCSDWRHISRPFSSSRKPLPPYPTLPPFLYSLPKILLLRGTTVHHQATMYCHITFKPVSKDGKHNDLRRSNEIVKSQRSEESLCWELPTTATV